MHPEKVPLALEVGHMVGIDQRFLGRVGGHHRGGAARERPLTGACWLRMRSARSIRRLNCDLLTCTRHALPPGRTDKSRPLK